MFIWSVCYTLDALHTLRFILIFSLSTKAQNKTKVCFHQHKDELFESLYIRVYRNMTMLRCSFWPFDYVKLRISRKNIAQTVPSTTGHQTVTQTCLTTAERSAGVLTSWDNGLSSRSVLLSGSGELRLSRWCSWTICYLDVRVK